TRGPGGPRRRGVAAGVDPLVRSGLALAGANLGANARGEDGLFTAAEVAALPLEGTSLVVLSACETGVGEVKNGEGVSSLAAAFRNAGAANVLMTLWPVHDDQTRAFMIRFYELVLSGVEPSVALGQVQREFLADDDDPTRRAPAAWAGFVVVGR
ncbi:MAG: CHAT domain-containing protein, partial [Planctomycetes bacterium]|nr:CHAT domain-containing protein [Planctomycetota bacterium]